MCFYSHDIEFIWSMIKCFLYHAMCLYIPKVRLNSRNHPRWFNSSIRHQIKCLHSLRRKYKCHLTPSRLNKIREYETQLQLDLCRAKANFEQNLLLQFNSNNTSKIFDYIHSLAGQCGLPAHVHYKSTTAESDQDKAQLFNRYFHSIFTTSSFPLPNLTELPNIYPCLSTITITQEEVYRTLVCLQPDKAAGCDGIGPKLLKSCALSLYKVFHHLFNLSLSQSYIPLEWRVHTIKPIHKSGDRTSVENYRPISLLCVSSKVLEKIIFKHIMEFVTTKISLYQLWSE